MKTVVTHNGVFHADEVTAIALLVIFTDTFSVDKDLETIVRTRNPKIIAKADIAIDVGGVYDKDKFQFDHHQPSYKGNLSSAGMIEHYIILDDYPTIQALVKEVDEQDTGVKRQSPNHYCNIISSFNYKDINSDIQYACFIDAVKFAVRYISNLKEAQLLKAHQADIAKQAHLQTISNVVFATVSEWIPVSNLIGIADFMISYDEAQEAWTVQQVPVKLGEFGGKYKLLATDASTEVFVHKAGFIAKYRAQYLDRVGLLSLTIDLVGLLQPTLPSE